MIDEKKLIDELRSWAKEARDVTSKERDVVADVIGLIEGQPKVGEWISCSERSPEEVVNPVTRDYYIYPVTIEIGGVTDVRYYKFGKGHWWNGPECMDKYVIAWRKRPEPWEGE